jgi:hypothetical protein
MSAIRSLSGDKRTLSPSLNKFDLLVHGLNDLVNFACGEPAAAVRPNSASTTARRGSAPRSTRGQKDRASGSRREAGGLARLLCRDVRSAWRCDVRLRGEMRRAARCRFVGCTRFHPRRTAPRAARGKAGLAFFMGRRWHLSPRRPPGAGAIARLPWPLPLDPGEGKVYRSGVPDRRGSFLYPSAIQKLAKWGC